MAIERSEFNRFKRFLCEHLELSREGTKGVLKLSQRELYSSLCERLEISKKQVAKYIAVHLGLPYMSAIDSDCVRYDLLTASYCSENFVLPLETGGAVSFCLSNPFDWHLLSMLEN